MAGPHSDDDWRVMLAALALHVLEVERGMRPPTQLEQLLPEPAFRLWQRQRRNGRLGGGPVTPADIGPVRFSRTDRSLQASIPTATSGGRWGALSLRLQRRPDGAWYVVDLHRLVPGRRYDRSREPTTVAPQREPAPRPRGLAR